jgi:tyrosine aminotransferase
MYTMVQVDISRLDSSIQDDLDFTKLLLKEENVFVLPGRAFGASIPCFRVVFCASQDLLRQASERIADFCARHAALKE